MCESIEGDGILIESQHGKVILDEFLRRLRVEITNGNALMKIVRIFRVAW